MNSFGRNFRVTIFGESHGGNAHGGTTGASSASDRCDVKQPLGGMVGVVLDGVRAGIPLTVNDFADDLARRQGDGGSRAGEQVRAVGVTPRRESDIPEIVSGVLNGVTTGAPLAIVFRNENTRSSDYQQFTTHPRPSHADWVAARKFSSRGDDGTVASHNDPRGGGHFSGRLTLGLVAAGVVAKKMMVGDVRVTSEIIEIGGVGEPSEFQQVIAAAMADGDSVGGVVECRASGVPVGLGEPFFDSVESVAGHLFFAIPGVKGVEFGSGFAGSRLRGSENNDPIVDAHGTTATNNAGGINGGLTNGNQIVARIAIKPTASISRPQQTFDFATGRVGELRVGGRHDTCIALRAAVVCEAALAIALCDLGLRR